MRGGVRFKDFNDDEKKEILKNGLLEDRNALLKKVKNEEKKEILQKSFDIFKRLKNRDRILNYMFRAEREDHAFVMYVKTVSWNVYSTKEDHNHIYTAVSNILLNKGDLISFIEKHPECFEQSVKYNKIIKNFFPENNFPNLKNNGR